MEKTTFSSGLLIALTVFTVLAATLFLLDKAGACDPGLPKSAYMQCEADHQERTER